ncbi:hypothetical protein EDD28_0035 [Salana multivorans]|uniref:LexA DNA binding domain-containing protein n=1 Tax=Salana multivorans TaxID=120377 RepID=A0A3N2D6V5_9MICO|nr:hypothetical protein EDD28_0035 [Salana multivorans]
MADPREKGLTPAQRQLLSEFRESSTGGLWIRSYSRWSRTTRVLVERGLIRRTDCARDSAFYEPVTRQEEDTP